MTTYYKAVRPDGTSFYDSTTRWEVGEVTVLPEDSGLPYLSVSVEPADCTGMEWPCRLFEVEPVAGHNVITPDVQDLPHKRGSTAWRVVRELDAHLALGPNGAEVAAIIARATTLTSDETSRITAWSAAWSAAWYATEDAAWSATEDVVWSAAWYATGYAAGSAAEYAATATLVRDLITPEQYETLMAPWWAGVGKEN